MFDSFLAKRGNARTFARRLVLRRPARRATYSRSLWSGKVVLARLALARLLSRRGCCFVRQCLSPDHSRRDGRCPGCPPGSSPRDAGRARPTRKATAARRCSARTGVPPTGSRHGPGVGGPIAGRMAVAWPSRARRGWFHDHHARHAGESGRVSASQDAEAPAAGFLDRSDPGHLLVGHGRGVGGGHRQDTKGRRPGREQLVSARCTTCWKPATSRWPTAISAAYSISRCSGQPRRGCGVAQSIKSELPTSARASVWDPMITSVRHGADPERPKWMPIEQ